MARIAAIEVSNFRSLRTANIPLRHQTILVGANNVGKTAVLELLDRCLSPARRGFGFDERDVSVGVATSEGFSALIEVAPTAGDKFTEDEVAVFGFHIDLGAPSQRILIRVTGRTEADDGIFRTRLSFEKSDGLDDGPVSAEQRAMLGYLLLPAIREGRHEFQERYGLWDRVASQAHPTPEALGNVRHLGDEYGDAVVAGLLGEGLRDQLSSAVGNMLSDVLYGGQHAADATFSLSALDPANVLRKVELSVRTPGQPEGRAVVDHSVGTQSVALFGLFGSYARAYGDNVVALGIEEPEAHLHPHAVRALVTKLMSIGPQVLISTHSTAVTDAADPRSVVVLRRHGADTVVSAIPEGTLDDADAAAVRRSIRAVGSDFLFARAVLLSEGDSERLALPMFAALEGIDADVLGISFVPVSGSDFKTFARLLGREALAIPFQLVCDLDAAAKLVGDLKSLRLLPDDVDASDLPLALPRARSLGFRWWSAGTFEDMLLGAGGTPLYIQAFRETHGATYLTRIAARDGVSEESPECVRAALQAKGARKPRLALRVAELWPESGLPLPPELEELLADLADTARSALAPMTTRVAEPEGGERDADASA